MKPWIAYVGPVPFPEGTAGSRRILGNALSMATAGRDVVVISGGEEDCPEMRLVAPGVRVISVRERVRSCRSRHYQYMNYPLMGRRTREWIGAQKYPPEAIVIYGGYVPYLMNLTGWARRHSIPVIFDAVEWYAAETWLGFALSPYLWSTEAAMRLLVPRADGVLAISRALESYYGRRGMPVLRVPPLIDTEAWPIDTGNQPPKTPLTLAYAGSPGRKDLLDTVVAAVLAVDENRQVLRLEIAGIDELELLRLPAISEWAASNGPELPNCIAVRGRISHASSMAMIGAAHFSVFTRRMNRVSTFGFPTKFVESFAAGTPVITNLTSDLQDHLRDGENGLVCEGPDQSDLERSLQRALRISVDEIRKMRAKARSEGERAFDYHRHAARFDAFLTRIGATGASNSALRS